MHIQLLFFYQTTKQEPMNLHLARANGRSRQKL